MPRTSSSTKTHIRALQAALDAEGLQVNYTQAHRVWDATTAAATDSPEPAVTAGAAPGAALLEAIRALLSSMGAHVASGNPSLAPLDGVRGRAEILRALGWEAKSDGCYEPRGPRIGTVKWDAEAGGWMVMFMPTVAFEEAARRHPHLIPADLSSAAAWTALWDDGLAAPAKSRRKRHGVPGSTIRIRVGDQMMTGVPVMLSTLLSHDEPAAPPASTGPDSASKCQWTPVDLEKFTWDPVQHGNLLITGGHAGTRNLLQSRLSYDLSDHEDVEVVQVNRSAVTSSPHPANPWTQVTRRHQEALVTGVVPEDVMVVDLTSEVSRLMDTYDGAGAYHQLKDLARTGAASNTFILARDEQPSHLIRTLLPHVEHAVLGLADDEAARSIDLPTMSDPCWTHLGATMVSFTP